MPRRLLFGPLSPEPGIRSTPARRRPAPRAARAGAVLAAGLALGAALEAQLGALREQHKVSELVGGFTGPLHSIDAFGSSVTALGDLDGDGHTDVAVGVPLDDDGGLDRGAVWILFLDAAGDVAREQKISSTRGAFAGPLHLRDRFGSSVAALGDLDGDGRSELAVGAIGDDDGGAEQGAVWILFLQADGSVREARKISATQGGFAGPLDPFDLFGSALAGPGDLDGDGVPDLLVGAPLDDDGRLTPDLEINKGALWALFLAPDGSVRAQQKISASEGGLGDVLEGGAFFGSSVAALGDLDGDGRTELAVGAPAEDGGGVDRGALWILFLGPRATVRTGLRITAGQGGFPGGLDDFDAFGQAVAPLGDLDCNGAVDLAVGAPGDDDGSTDRGALWVLLLERDGHVRAQGKLTPFPGGFGGGLDAQDAFGQALASLGDLDGDGVLDLAVGAPGDDDGGAGQGAVWWLFLEGLVRLDFEHEDDFATPLANGQQLSTPPEFGRLVALASAGPNAGAALFDSTPGGPNDPSQDRDLLVGSGNVLILQTDANPTQTRPGTFDRPNDDADGGTLTFLFPRAVHPRQVALIDIDAGVREASRVVLTDELGHLRVYTVPPDWTGDILTGGIGRLALDLETLAPQAGFGSSATAVEDPGFRLDAVTRLEVHLGGSGAVDDLCWQPSFPKLHHGPWLGAPPGSRGTPAGGTGSGPSLRRAPSGPAPRPR